MLLRPTTIVLSAALSVSTLVGMAAAQQAPADTNADGTYVVASDNGNPTASGEGSGVVYGDVNTGGAGGQVLGDPSAVNSPGLSNVPVRNGTGWTLPVSDGHNDMAPEGQTGTTTGDATTTDSTTAAPATDGTTSGDATTADGATTTDIQNVDGTASSSGAAPVPVNDQAGVPVDGSTPPVDQTAAAPVDTGATGSAFSCADYANWYDAQVAYENAGGTAGDPAVVSAADPDYDGIACEEMM